MTGETIFLGIVGLAGGIIAGLTGIGTGIVMLAVIPFILPDYGVPDKLIVSVTIANSIFTNLVAAATNVITTIRREQFYPRETLWVGLSAVVISFLTFEFIVKSSFYSKRLFNAILVVVLLAILIQSFRKLNLSTSYKEQISKLKMIVTGGAAGSLAALTGLGGGIITMPLLNLWSKIDIVKAKSISFGTILAIAGLLSFNNLFLHSNVTSSGSIGLIIFPMMGPMLAGIIIGSPIGIVLSERVPARVVSVTFLLLATFVTIQKIIALFS